MTDWKLGDGQRKAQAARLLFCDRKNVKRQTEIKRCADKKLPNYSPLLQTTVHPSTKLC
jgi:hypothetical protein